MEPRDIENPIAEEDFREQLKSDKYKEGIEALIEKYEGEMIGIDDSDARMWNCYMRFISELKKL